MNFFILYMCVCVCVCVIYIVCVSCVSCANACACFECMYMCVWARVCACVSFVYMCGFGEFTSAYGATLARRRRNRIRARRVAVQSRLGDHSCFASEDSARIVPLDPLGLGSMMNSVSRATFGSKRREKAWKSSSSGGKLERRDGEDGEEYTFIGADGKREEQKRLCAALGTMLPARGTLPLSVKLERRSLSPLYLLSYISRLGFIILLQLSNSTNLYTCDNTRPPVAPATCNNLRCWGIAVSCTRRNRSAKHIE